MLRNLKEVEHPDMTEEFVKLLSTTEVIVKHRVVSGIEIDGTDCESGLVNLGFQRCEFDIESVLIHRSRFGVLILGRCLVGGVRVHTI